MNDRIKQISGIEKYIDFLDENYGRGANLPETQQLNSNEFKKELNSIGYEYFIHLAETHYFVGRILFLNKFGEYGCFCAHQCIENYLKAFIKFKTDKPKLGHKLTSLLEDAKVLASDEEEFIKGKRIFTIARRFEPYYEFSRYPVAKTRPQRNVAGAMLFPDDYFLVDYFMLSMREIIDKPERMTSVFRSNPPLYGIDSPIIEIFKKENINFP